MPKSLPVTRNPNNKRSSTPSSSIGHVQVALLVLQLLIICGSFVPMFSKSSSSLRSLLTTMTTDASANISTTATTSTSTSAQTDDPPAQRLERLQKYVHRYNYTAPWNSPQPAPPECGVGPDYAAFFAQDGKKHSRAAEDKNMYNLLFRNASKSGKGTYVELGAYNGIHESNTRFFDICLGWKGLLIEGNPKIFPQTRLERPQAHRMSFAPSCRAEGTAEFHPTIWTNAGLEGKALAYNGTRTVSVPCGPLGPVFQDVFEGQRLNFFSLDVEGAETMVLETIDFTKIQIDVLMIEVENTFCPRAKDCEQRNGIRRIMKEQGYKRYYGVVSFSDVYIHPKSPYQFATIHPNWQVD